jgi:uncharacterized OsmC-like protein
VNAAPPVRRLALVDGRTLAHRAYGPAGGAPLLFVPGVASGSLMRVGEELLDGRGLRLLSVGRPGLGSSDADAGKTLASVGDDLHRLAATLGGPVPVVANSEGAPFALAATLAGAASRLVLVSPVDEVAHRATTALLPEALPEALRELFGAMTRATRPIWGPRWPRGSPRPSAPSCRASADPSCGHVRSRCSTPHSASPAAHYVTVGSGPAPVWATTGPRWVTFPDGRRARSAQCSRHRGRPDRGTGARIMTETTITATETVRNGVDTTTMFATLDAIKAQPEIAEFRFRARNRWLGGAHNRSTIKDFYAACDEDTTRTEAFTLDAGEPAILLGTDTGPNPAEYLLHALAACVTTSLVYSAAARKVKLTMVESTLEGDLNIEGAMGTNTVDFRNGFTGIRMSVRIAGDAPADKLREVVQRGTDRSVVFDSISAGVPISVDVTTV